MTRNLNNVKIWHKLNIVKIEFLKPVPALEIEQKAMPPKQSYHHGNLRVALLDAARELLEENGIETVTLRGVARRAGVSAGAPYHHFADKTQLLGALSHACFEELDAISRLALQTQSTPHARLKALGNAYIRYAIDHPARFRLMFRPEIGTSDELPKDENTLVFGLLVRVLEEIYSANGHSPVGGGNHHPATGDRLRKEAIAAWSLVHGFAALLIDGPLQAMLGAPQQLDSTIETLLDGLVDSYADDSTSGRWQNRPGRMVQ